MNFPFSCGSWCTQGHRQLRSPPIRAARAQQFQSRASFRRPKLLPLSVFHTTPLLQSCSLLGETHIFQSSFQQYSRDCADNVAKSSTSTSPSVLTRSHVMCHKKLRRRRRDSLVTHYRIVCARRSKSQPHVQDFLRLRMLSVTSATWKSTFAHRQINTSCPVMRQHIPLHVTQHQSSTLFSMTTHLQAGDHLLHCRPAESLRASSDSSTDTPRSTSSTRHCQPWCHRIPEVVLL